MKEDLILYGTNDCHRCTKLSEYLNERGISHSKISIDQDPEAKTDTLMYKIFSVPALKKGGMILQTKEIFDINETINEDSLNRFLSN